MTLKKYFEKFVVQEQKKYQKLLIAVFTYGEKCSQITQSSFEDLKQFNSR